MTSANGVLPRRTCQTHPIEHKNVNAMRQKVHITEERALARVAALCAKAEYCTGDIDGKLRLWGLDDEARQGILSYLTEHQYVDNARYCRAFVNDKIAYNRWGRRKIEQALWMKRIPESVSKPILDEIDEEKYMEVLKPLLKAKRHTIKAESDYELDMKLIKFALGRGFTMEEIRKCL